jgi:hypothetical protein
MVKREVGKVLTKADAPPPPHTGQGLQLITTLKKNTKPVPRTDFVKTILRRRSLIETVFDEFKVSLPDSAHAAPLSR